MQFRRILCPTDFSKPALRAYCFAGELARDHRGSLDLVHVRPMVASYADQYPYITAPPITDSDLQALAHEHLEAFRARANVDNVTTRLHLLQGSPATSILATIDSLEPDLVCMGTHGRGGLERYAMGSVTEHVLRKSRCPVLSLGESDEEIPPPQFRRILCPIDFSNDSKRGLALALQLARQSRGELSLLHVLEWAGESSRLPSSLSPRKATAALEASRLDDLVGLVEVEDRSQCVVHELVRSGKPYECVLEEITKGSIDLVVIGMGGRNRLGLALLGSTTHRVVRHSPCPVLTIRA